MYLPSLLMPCRLHAAFAIEPSGPMQMGVGAVVVGVQPEGAPVHVSKTNTEG